MSHRKVIDHLKAELENYQYQTVTEKRSDFFQYMSELEKTIDFLSLIEEGI